MINDLLVTLLWLFAILFYFSIQRLLMMCYSIIYVLYICLHVP